MPAKTADVDPATLKGWIADARKKPLSFAILLSPGGIVMQADKVKSPDQMRKAAKAAGGGGKGCWGKMEVQQKTLMLTCEGKPPGGIEKQIRRFLSEAGFPMQIELQSADALAAAAAEEAEAQAAQEEEARAARPKRRAAEEPDGDSDPAGAPSRARADGASPEPERGTDAQSGDETTGDTRGVEDARSASAPRTDADESDEEGVVEGDVEDNDDDNDGADLASAIKLARKKPLNFACMLSDGGVVLVTHRRKQHGILIKQAKSDGGGPKGGWGQLSVEGKTLVLTCEEEPPGALARRLKLHLRANGQKFAVAIRSPAGEMLEPDEEENQAHPTKDGDAAPPSARSESAPQPAEPGAEEMREADGARPEDESVEDEGGALSDWSSIIKIARKKPLNAALLIGGEAGVVLRAHRKKPTELLVRQAKQEGAKAKGAWGKLGVSGKMLALYCQPDPPPQLLVVTKQALAAQGLSYRLALLPPTGDPLAESDGTDADDQRSQTSDPDAREDRLRTAIDALSTRGPEGARDQLRYLQDRLADPGLEPGLRQRILSLLQSKVEHFPMGPLDPAAIAQALDRVPLDSNETGAIDAFARGSDMAGAEAALAGRSELGPMRGTERDYLVKTVLSQATFPPPGDGDGPASLQDDSEIWVFDTETGRFVRIAMGFYLAEKDVGRRRYIGPDDPGFPAPQDPPPDPDSTVPPSPGPSQVKPTPARPSPQALPDQSGDPVVYLDGARTGTPLATLGPRDIKAKTRLSRSFGAREAAAAFARNLKMPAAVVMEDGVYVIYEIEMEADGWFDFTDLEITDIENEDTADRTDTELARKDPALATLITEDDHVISFAGKQKGTVDRTGSTQGEDVEVSPFAAHLQAFGPGLRDIKDEDAFNRQFELAMRDVAYEMVGKAEGEAKRVQARLSGAEMLPEDKAAVMEVLKKLGPIDAEIEKLESESSKLMFSMIGLAPAHPGAIMTQYQMDALAEITAKRKAIQEKIAQLQMLRTQVAQPYPLALRLEDTRAFLDAETDDEANVRDDKLLTALKAAADGVVEDVATTKENLDNGDLDLWTNPGLVATTQAGLGVQGQQAEWANEKVDWEGTKDTAAAIGEGVLTIGLAVGAFFVPGPGWVAIAMGATSFAVGGISAYMLTTEYNRKDAAADIGLDPNEGLIPQEDVPHWGWVAAAWVGVGLDAAGVAATVKAIRGAANAADAIKVLESTSEGRQAVQKLMEAAGVPPSQMGKFIEDTLKPALLGKYGGKIGKFDTEMMGEALFESTFKNSTAEAVTTVSRNGDKFDVRIIARSDMDPARRLAAIKEETRHLAQLLDPKNADDVSKLTDEALAGWSKMDPGSRVDAMKAKARLEKESQEILLKELRQKFGPDLENLPAGQRPPGSEPALVEIEEAKALIARYDDQLAQLDDAAREIRGGSVPAWVDNAPPPHLFSDPKFVETNKKALAWIKANGGGVDDVPDGHYFIEKGGGYEMRRFKEGDPRRGNVGAQQLVRDGEGWKTVESARKSVTEVRADVEALYGTPLRNTKLETAITSRFDDPYMAAYARKFADAFEELGDARYAQVLEAAKGSSVSNFDNALRHAMRGEMIKVVNEADGAAKMSRLKEFMDAMPDNGSRGSLFSEFRAANMGDDLVPVAKTSGATQIAGQTKMGDGIVELPAAKVVEDASTLGPSKAGRYLAEDKSGQAFRASQAKNYLNQLFENDGLLKMADGGETRGVTYFFDSVDEAAKAVTQIDNLKPDGVGKMTRELRTKLRKIKASIHVGYYDADGALIWVK
ncbi:MAG: hypothetical protein AAGB05_12865 [Pseudomonadota bacterium]